MSKVDQEGLSRSAPVAGGPPSTAWGGGSPTSMDGPKSNVDPAEMPSEDKAENGEAKAASATAGEQKREGKKRVTGKRVLKSTLDRDGDGRLEAGDILSSASSAIGLDLKCYKRLGEYAILVDHTRTAHIQKLMERMRSCDLPCDYVVLREEKSDAIIQASGGIERM